MALSLRKAALSAQQRVSITNQNLGTQQA